MWKWKLGHKNTPLPTDYSTRRLFHPNHPTGIMIFSSSLNKRRRKLVSHSVILTKLRSEWILWYAINANYHSTLLQAESRWGISNIHCESNTAIINEPSYHHAILNSSDTTHLCTNGTNIVETKHSNITASCFFFF